MFARNIADINSVWFLICLLFIRQSLCLSPQHFREFKDPLRTAEFKHMASNDIVIVNSAESTTGHMRPVFKYMLEIPSILPMGTGLWL